MEYSKNAIEIYKRLYFDELHNETETYQVHLRVAEAVGNNCEEHNIFTYLLDNKIFRPNSPCLINAGRKSDKPHDTQLCACFVLGLEDSMDSIINMWGICALIYASGAGAGIPITNLREYKSPIASGGTASGPLRYLRVVDLLSDTVRSGGRTRRAANIGIFRFDHPETVDIIESKTNGKNKLSSFNLSMSVDNLFMIDLDNDGMSFNIISPNKEKIIGEKLVKDLWNLVIDNAWKCGDPGLLFIDKVNQFNPFPNTFPIEATNPCGEVPLAPWSVCNIGSINLNYMIVDGSFNWNRFTKVIHDCVLFLDNVIDTTSYLHPNFENMSKSTRPIGLGIMGFADILIKLGIAYDSDDAKDLFEEICRVLTVESIRESINLVKETNKRPIHIPLEDKQHFRYLLKYYTNDDQEILNDYDKYGIRNCTWTCIAPTGSISMSADCSYAWEPLMALVWEKPLVDSDQVLKIIHPQFEKDLEKWIEENVHDSYINSTEISKRKEKIIEDIIKNNGSIQKLEYLPNEMKRIYLTAHDIDPFKKIEMQGVGQKYISLAISSTCNLPHSATKEDISEIYKHAYECGLKGITIFRDGCLDKQIVNFGKIEKEKTITVKPVERPIRRKGETIEINTPHGKLFVTCNFENNPIQKPFEIFFRVGKQGALTNVLIDALGRVCSKAMQFGMPLEHIAETLRGLSGEKFWFKIDDVVEKSNSAESIVDAISQIIEHHWTYVTKSEMLKPVDIYADEAVECELEECPECHRKSLRHDTGCRGGYCIICGFSNCG